MSCQELSDRMPEVARGDSSWTESQAEHLAACADCRSEWEVVSAGANIAHGVTVDAAALAELVLLRLRTEPAISRFPRRRWFIGLAAAAVTAIVLLPARLPRGPAAPPTASLAVDVPGLHALGEEGLAELLESMAPSWTDTPTNDTPSLDDLDPRELEQVQRLWEI